MKKKVNERFQYFSIVINIREDDKLIIDRQVSRNHKTVCTIVKKIKREIVVTTLVNAFWFNNLESAIGLSMPHAPVRKIQPNYKDTYKMKVAPIVNLKLEEYSSLVTIPEVALTEKKQNY